MHLVVDADKRGSPLNLKELLHYKDLFYILAYCDLQVQYAQTFLRLFWAFLKLLPTLNFLESEEYHIRSLSFVAWLHGFTLFLR